MRRAIVAIADQDSWWRRFRHRRFSLLTASKCLLAQGHGVGFSKRDVVDSINRISHSEEAAQRLSRRTHGTDPANRQFLHSLEGGNPGAPKTAATAPFSGQALDPRFRACEEMGVCVPRPRKPFDVFPAQEAVMKSRSPLKSSPPRKRGPRASD
jgi:hypothetical protein